ncbi:MAG TPA: DMT family transporter [Candidatus Saccharimonadales bacterium]|nr:DMT family transporter [Candidatus Saccharimonadales bacterium]
MIKRRLNAPLGASIIVLSSLFYASYGIWTTLMGNFFGGYTASALRSILVLVIMVPVAIARHQLGPINWRRHWPYVAGLLFSSCFTWGPFYYAVLHAGIGIALTINYAGIVIGMFFFGWLFARERFSKDKWLATLLGLIGLYLIFTPSIADLGWLALVGAAVSGLSIASNSVIVKHLPYNATQSTVFLWATSVVANIFMASVFREQHPAVGWYAQWLYLVFFAIASVAASWLFITGLKLVEAGVAGILGLLEIVFGVLFGILFFSEHVGSVVDVGIITIIAAAAIPYIRDYNAQRGTLDKVGS